MSEAKEALEEEDFASAEANYRKAISKDPTNASARYNLGNLYHNKELTGEALERDSQAAEIAAEKPLKHKSFHNKGNAYMEQKKYPEAIEAYKDALRNNPNDDETRYNLALAKKLWEQEKKDGGSDSDQEKGDQEKDQKENQEQKGDQGDQEQEPGGDDRTKAEQSRTHHAPRPRRFGVSTSQIVLSADSSWPKTAAALKRSTAPPIATAPQEPVVSCDSVMDSSRRRAESAPTSPAIWSMTRSRTLSTSKTSPAMPTNSTRSGGRAKAV